MAGSLLDTEALLRQTHWDDVYQAKTAAERSWFRPHLDASLNLIQRTTVDLSTPIMDVGGGESTLVDDLITAGYRRLTVVDISEISIEHTKARLGEAAEQVSWHCADVLTLALPKAFFGVWHDRAVFHFLTQQSRRAEYVEQAAMAVRPGGRVIVGTFGLGGPLRCSGLDVIRYDAMSLAGEFGSRFDLISSLEELHISPSGAKQPFVYVELVRC